MHHTTHYHKSIYQPIQTWQNIFLPLIIKQILLLATGLGDWQFWKGNPSMFDLNWSSGFRKEDGFGHNF
jgi:hypothetical protein